MPFSTGEAFAGFGIVRLLGSGGMGEVYLAEHPRVPRRGALKVLAADVSGGKSGGWRNAMASASCGVQTFVGSASSAAENSGAFV